MNEKKPGAKFDTQSADYLRSYPVDCTRQFIQVIELGQIEKFAGQGGMQTKENSTGPNTGIGGLKAPVWHSLTYSGGRPSSRERVRQEAKRRLDKGRYPGTPEEFCQQLSKWLADLEQMTGEQIPQMTPPVVRRHIDDLLNEFRSRQR
jgi:hypothetical protein